MMQDDETLNPDEKSTDRFRRLASSEEEAQPTQPASPNESEGEDTQAPGDEYVSLSSQLSSQTRPPLKPRPVEPGSDTIPEDLSSTPPSGSLRSRETLPPPPSGRTPLKAPPAFGPDGTPLPRRVDEVDLDATRVSPAAYTPPASSIPTHAAPPHIPPTRHTGAPPAPASAPRFAARPRAHSRSKLRTTMGCLLRLILLGIFILVGLLIAGGTFVVYEYYSIASTLPSVSDLQQRASQFETTRILDRNGKVLYEILDPNAGRRTYVKLNRVSPYLVAATIATEDKGYYSHPGFDIFAIVRAFYQNYQGGETVSGASTITQQLARSLLLSPQERVEESYMRKVREAILAAEITRRYSKDEILELYLNEIYYGNLSYGIEAASETYFGVTADKLTLGQAAFLAGLPQSPSVYDVYANHDATLHRMNNVLVLMMTSSKEENCIYVSNSPEKVCVDQKTAEAAFSEMALYNFQRPDIKMTYPHWVNYVRSLLESQYDAQTIYRSGFTVYTTLDPDLQNQAEKIVKDQVDSLADKHVTDGALVAIQPKTGEILAMVGSADFYDKENAGEVNMAISPRQPGSAIKPLTYVAAFEKGWTPATVIWDVPSQFPPSGDPNDPREPYEPVNYDGRFHGPVSVRAALANSYNIPAVKTLDFIGIYHDPNNPNSGGLIPFARRLGITTLTRDDYGLSLTLGGGEVNLLEFTGAYATFANNGAYMPPVAITKILDYEGKVVYQYQPPAPQQVVRPEHAYLISNILSDNEARTPMFGANSVLNLPFQAAAKTGTTNDFRDNWTMGYTPDLAVGVWVGNADWTQMEHTTGVTGAAPIWSDFMKFAEDKITGGNPTPFTRPAGIVERLVCTASGTEPSQWCPDQRRELFASDQPPLPKDQDLWTKVWFDTWTGLRASQACSTFIKEDVAINVKDPWAKKWLTDDPDGQAWAQDMGFPNPLLFVPDRECKADDPHALLAAYAPTEGQTVNTSPFDIIAKIDATGGFANYRLDWAPGDNPVDWTRLSRGSDPVKDAEKIYSWDVSEIPAGPVSLRILMRSDHDTYAELIWRINLQVPTPTPTPSPTPAPTATPAPPQPPAETPIGGVTTTLTPGVSTASPIKP